MHHKGPKQPPRIGVITQYCVLARGGGGRSRYGERAEERAVQRIIKLQASTSQVRTRRGPDRLGLGASVLDLDGRVATAVFSLPNRMKR